MRLRLSQTSLRFLEIILFTCASIILLFAYVRHGRDFEVFWNTGRHILNQEPIYSVHRDGYRVFKYPPFTALFFVPFALLPLSIAKFFWGVLQCLSLFAVFDWVKVRCSRPQGAWVGFLVFWGLWRVHAMDGQISLLMLALALTANSKPIERLTTRVSVVFTALSLKIFSAFALLGLKWNRRSVQVVLLYLGIAGGLSLLVSLWVGEGGILGPWLQALSEGQEILGEAGVRGKYNQGLPALFLRALDASQIHWHLDLWVTGMVAGLLAGFWWQHSKKMSFEAAWVGWLALVPVVHPLPFWYSFVFVFPLAVLCIDRAFFDRARVPGNFRRSFRILTFMGVAGVAAITSKTLGPIGAVLELASIKSVSTLLLLWIWARLCLREPRRHVLNKV